MKMKFQEFAKDYGLIVVGYAGHDRSIMDILAYLLQHEDYFKNGIYWCLRVDKNSQDEITISPELKKLLWRDRVFFVEIEGFDELFAEINHRLNSGTLPVDDAFLSRAHQETIIKELTENKWLNLEDSSSYLAQDCEKLKQHFQNNIESDFLKFLRDKKSNQPKDGQTNVRRKSGFSPLTQEEGKDLNELVAKAFGLGQVREVEKYLDSKGIFDMPDSQYKIELLELATTVKKDMGDETIRRYYDELIRLVPWGEIYYEAAADRLSDIEQSLMYLKSACAQFKTDAYILNKYTKKLLDCCEEYLFSSEKTENWLAQIWENIENSLKLNQDIGNRAHVLKIKYFKIKYKNDRERREREIEFHCNLIHTRYPLHINTIIILREAETEMFSERLIRETLERYITADDDNCERGYIENC